MKNLFPKISYKRMKKDLEEIQAKPVKDLKSNYNKYFYPGQMIFFSYDAKDKKSPFDKNPMIIVLRTGKKYTLGLNFHWTPIKFRKTLIDFIFKINKQNIKSGKKIKLSYQDVKKIIKGLGPVIRLYINDRISTSGAIVEPYLFQKAIELKTEDFIGITPEQAWSYATKKFKTKNTKNRKNKRSRRKR